MDPENVGKMSDDGKELMHLAGWEDPRVPERGFAGAEDCQIYSMADINNVCVRRCMYLCICLCMSNCMGSCMSKRMCICTSVLHSMGVACCARALPSRIITRAWFSSGTFRRLVCAHIPGQRLRKSASGDTRYNDCA